MNENSSVLSSVEDSFPSGEASSEASETFSSVGSSSESSLAYKDFRDYSFVELALLAIVLMIFFKWFVIDLFQGRL